MRNRRETQMRLPARANVRSNSRVAVAVRRIRARRQSMGLFAAAKADGQGTDEQGHPGDGDSARAAISSLSSLLDDEDDSDGNFQEQELAGMGARRGAAKPALRIFKLSEMYTGIPFDAWIKSLDDDGFLDFLVVVSFIVWSIPLAIVLKAKGIEY